MTKTDEYCIMMDGLERRVLLKSLSEFRNTLIDESLPTEDVDEMLLKVYHSPPVKKKRGNIRDAR